MVKEAVQSKPDAILLGGGDGTISGLVDFMIGTGIPVGLLPLGTANSFARSLALPLDIDEAIDCILAGNLRRIDLGKINNDYFANCAAMGMSPLIASTIPGWVKKWGGRAGYALWAAWCFVRFRPFRLVITDENGRESRMHALEVRIANGNFQGGAELVDSAAVDSGDIVVQTVEGKRHGRLVVSWMMTLLHLPAVKSTTHEIRGRNLRIDAFPPQDISIDGEVLARTPIIAGVAPGAIEVLAPAPEHAPERAVRAGTLAPAVSPVG